MLTIAAGAYFCGRLMDRGISARTVASGTGMIMLVPAALWALSMKSAMKKSEAEDLNLVG
jgi:predicted MFS family arabinose efflux permease